MGYLLVISVPQSFAASQCIHAYTLIYIIIKYTIKNINRKPLIIEFIMPTVFNF